MDARFSSARSGNPKVRTSRVPSLRAAWVIGAAGLILAAGLLLFAVIGNEHDPAQPAAQHESMDIGHVHGIGVDPADDDLYIGAHFGLFSIDEQGTVRLVGERRNDTMAFTVTGPNRFLASGHPALTDNDQPVHLGLIESRDAGRSWQPVSLSGEADFHALEVRHGRTWGVDSAGGRLLTSTDPAQWTVLTRRPLLDIAVEPRAANRALATTPSGKLVSFRTNGFRVAISQAPRWLTSTGHPRANCWSAIRLIAPRPRAGPSWPPTPSASAAPPARRCTPSVLP